jgi:hypothetical protein
MTDRAPVTLAVTRPVFPDVDEPHVLRLSGVSPMIGPAPDRSCAHAVLAAADCRYRKAADHNRLGPLPLARDLGDHVPMVVTRRG